MANTDLKPPTYEPPSYRFFSREEVAELRELKQAEREARSAFEATLSDEQRRLAYKLTNAPDERDQREHYFTMRAMIRHLAEHFPGIAPALRLMAGHCAWGSDINMAAASCRTTGRGSSGGPGSQGCRQR